MIRTIIIDDELHSRETTRMMLDMVDHDIEIIAEANHAREGSALVNALQPDLILLDIQMPDITGIQMLDMISGYTGEIIFITAHDEYAIEAFKKGAIHYLLKPLDPDDLDVALSRVKETLNYINTPSDGHWLSLSTQDGWIVIRKNDIYRCESFKNYTTLVCGSESHTISKTLKNVESILSPDKFYRVHNSHLINIEHIDKVLKTEGGNVLLKNGDLIPISKNRKKDFFDWFLRHMDNV